MTKFILILALIGFNANAVDKDLGNKASFCYAYSKFGGMKKSITKEHLKVAVKNNTMAGHAYVVGLAEGITETTAFYQKSTKKGVAIFLYNRKCLTKPSN